MGPLGVAPINKSSKRMHKTSQVRTHNKYIGGHWLRASHCDRGGGTGNDSPILGFLDYQFSPVAHEHQFTEVRCHPSLVSNLVLLCCCDGASVGTSFPVCRCTLRSGNLVRWSCPNGSLEAADRASLRYCPCSNSCVLLVSST